MRITVCLTDTRPDPWVAGLRAALPGTDIENWEPGTPPADGTVEELLYAPGDQVTEGSELLRIAA